MRQRNLSRRSGYPFEATTSPDLLTAASREGLEGVRAALGDDHAPDERRQLAPAEPPRDVDVALGLLDRIAAAVESFAEQERGPAGEGTAVNAGSVTGPAAGQAIATVQAPGAGRYRVVVTVAKDAGAVALDLRLRAGALTLSPLPVSTGLTQYVLDEVALDGGEQVDVFHPVGAGGTFTAHIAVTRVE